MRRTALLPLFLLLAACAANTTNEPPLPPDKIEAVLTDLELVEAYGITAGLTQPDSTVRALQEAVYKRHGMSAAQYQEYIDWYYQHPMALDSVYKHVKEKLEAMPDSF